MPQYKHVEIPVLFVIVRRFIPYLLEVFSFFVALKRYKNVFCKRQIVRNLFRKQL